VHELRESAFARHGAARRCGGASRAWLARTLPLVRAVALRQSEFTTDDIVFGEDQPREPRALGPLMLAAAKAGWIRPANRTRKSLRASCHARPKAVWLSRLR
jgi:hypothetical protein